MKGLSKKFSRVSKFFSRLLYKGDFMSCSLDSSLVQLDQTTTANLAIEMPTKKDKYRKISLKGVPLTTPIKFNLELKVVDERAKKTFGELIYDKEKNQKPYFLALLVENHSKKNPLSLFPYRFCDAAKLNASLCPEEPELKILKNLHAILYFSLQPGAKKFAYLASEIVNDNSLKRDSDVMFMIAENDQDSNQGKLTLAKCYEKGLGTEKNRVKAFQCYKSAADQNVTAAQIKTAEYYAKGIGIEKDLKMAATYYQTLSQKGNCVAQYALGVIYQKGKIDKPDLAQAVQQFTLASKQGCVKSLHRLGALYLTGEGVKKNPEKGIALLKQAAEQGSAKSFFVLGQIYEKGEIVKKDLSAAKDYYRKAEKLEYRKAGTALAELPGFNIFK